MSSSIRCFFSSQARIGGSGSTGVAALKGTLALLMALASIAACAQTRPDGGLAPDGPAASPLGCSGAVCTHSLTSVNFGPVSVGATSTAATATFTFATADTLASFAVLTQGAPNLDFNSVATGTTCAVNTPYAAGATCTVAVTFTPRFSGTRYGGVVLTGTSGAVMGNFYLTGVGQGPQTSFPPGTQSQIASGLGTPYGIVADGGGNLFVLDTNNNRVVKETFAAGAYTQSTVVTSLYYPEGIAIDGSGNLYIGDTYNNRVLKETPTATGYTQSVIVTGLSQPRGVAVDGSGNLYIVNSTSNQVLMETLSASAYTQTVIASGLYYPTGVAVDGSGNVYIADTYNNRVLMETLTAGVYAQSVLVTGLYGPNGVCVDGVGNLYIADTSNNRVLKETLSAGTYTQSVVDSGLNIPRGVAVDGAGNLYVADSNNARAMKVDLADPYTVSFANTAYGLPSSDSPKTVTVGNSGNANLTFSAVAFPGDFPENSQAGSDCASGSIVAPQATCTLTIDFTPVTALSSTSASQFLAENVTLTTNSLNVAGTQQLFPVNGTEAKLTPAVTLAASANPSTITTALTFTATVQGSGTTPTGTVTFFSGTNVLGTGTLSGGIATFTTSSLAAGSYSITALYGGNLSYVSTPSSAITQIITLLTPTVTLLSSADPATVGSAITFTARVLGSGSPATGKVTFQYGATILGTATLSGSVASLTTSALAVGTYAVTASYAGNTLYLPAVSNTLTEIVTLPLPAVWLTSSLNPATAGAAVTFTATVTGGSTIPAGTVTFFAGALALGTSTLSGGVATLTSNSLLPGSYSISAAYAGSTAYAPATSNTITQVVTPLLPAVTLATSANPSPAGTPIVFSAMVSAVTGWGMPTGTVTFYDGATVLNTAPLINGLATFKTGTLPMGAYTVTAAYSGNQVYGAAVSTSITESITVANFGSVAVGASATALIPVLVGSTGKLSGILVLTQGAPGLDFTNPAGGTCALNTAYPVGAICTVNVTFTPRFTGTRSGGIVLINSNGDLMATAYVQGTGAGPQTVFAPAMQIPIGSAWSSPNGVAADGNGNLYVADLNYGDVYKETPAGTGFTQITIASGLKSPVVLAVDGAGNVYVADNGSSVVYKETLLNGIYSQSALFTALYNIAGGAVDGSGNIYLASSNYLYKETLTNGVYSQSTIGGFSRPVGVAVDGAGSVYVADSAAGAVYKEVWSNQSYTQNTVATHLNITGVAVDGNANVYVAVQGGIASDALPAGVYLETPLYGSYTETAIGSGWTNPSDLAVDGRGNAYVIDGGKLFEADSADPPALSYASTTQGSTSTDSPRALTVSNLGNAPLKFSAVSYAPDFPESSAATGDCKATTVLAVGTSCPLTINFTPVTAMGANPSIALSESVTVTTNTLNATAAAQATTVTGTEMTQAWTVRLTASATTVTVGSPITFTATVGVGAPSGTVTFYSGNSVIIASALNGNVATAIVSSLPAGAHSITAVYSNTTSNAIAVTINKAATAVKLASTVTKTTAGSAVGFTVTAATRSNVAPPAGTVSLYSGKTLLGTMTLHNGTATLSTRSLAAGADTVSAVYAGDLNYLNATSNPVTVTVVLPSAALPAFSLAAGAYTKPQSVKLSAATAGATIYYTTNGAEPTTASAKYSGAIKVTSTETIKAMTAAAGYANSNVASATYTIATAPSAATSAATALTASGATLNGSVTANNAATQYWFAYGTSKTGLTGKTAKTGALTAAAPTAVTSALTGLKTRTTYYFRIVASNAVGTDSGAILSFTTH